MFAMDAHVERLHPMRRPALKPSRRLLAAAAAERDTLRRQRDDLIDRRQQLQREIAQIDVELAALEGHDDLLGRLGGGLDAGEGAADAAGSSATVQQTDGGSSEAHRVLRGPAIRQVAVQVLLADPRRPEALHYREWFALVQQAGYTIAGKDPLAVFLTQLSRSPVVRRGTQSGVYEIDLAAGDRLRHQLDDRQHQLRNLTAHAAASANLGEVRARRTGLTQEIDKLEKALQEAEAVLSVQPGRLAAAS